jgi:hypothetical protein
VSAHPVDDLAAVIRRHPNNVDTRILATAAAIHLTPGEPDCGPLADAVGEIIDRVNPDRTMDAGRLAEAILDDLTT